MKLESNKIKLQAIDFKASRKLSAFVRKHVAKLNLLSDRIVESHVSLKVNASTGPENKVCEITLMMPGKDLFVSKTGQSFEESIAIAVDALKHPLEHWKASTNGKRKNLRKSS